MDEVTLYNLHATAAGAGHRARAEANNYALALMMVHLHIEHKMGVRDIAKRFDVKMVDVKKVIAEKRRQEGHCS